MGKFDRKGKNPRGDDKSKDSGPREEEAAAAKSVGHTTNLLSAEAKSSQQDSKPKPTAKPNFTPKALSTKPSADKNDPLTSDMLTIDGIKGYVRSTHTRTFGVDFSQFPIVVRASYDAQVTADRSLRKYLSYGAFYYYCTVALWRRILQIYSYRGLHQQEYQALTSYLGETEMVLPEDVLLYIAGIGDVEDFSQRNFKLDIAMFPLDALVDGLPGHFGRVGHNSHILYETMPAPAVSVLKVLADLRRSLLPAARGPTRWNLPDGLRPQNTEELPTPNLLGYSYADLLSAEQRQMFEAAGVVVDQDGTHQFPHRLFRGIPVNQPLITAVASYLLHSKVAVTKTWNDTAKGSVAQIPYAIKDVLDDTPGQLSAKVMGSACYSQAGTACACAAMTFRYRIQRTTNGNYLDSLCYRLEDRGWDDNCNDIFNRGNVALWNVPEFRVAEASGLALANDLAIRVRKSVISKTKTES